MSKIPEGFIFENKRGETLMKAPNSIKEQVFNMKDLVECTVYILDISATIYIDNCVDCRFYVAPVTGSFYLRDSRNCVCSVACKQMRVKNCTNATFFLYSVSDPHIEKSFDMKFAPYNFAYPGQTDDFKRVGFDVKVNLWCKVFDHSSSEGDGHFSLLPPKEFKKEEKRLEGYGNPVNPVPIPQQYGGDLAENIVPGSKFQNKPEPAHLEANRNEHVLENSNFEGDIQVFYDEKEGFVLGELELPRQFDREELRRKIMQYSDAGKEYYAQWSEHVFAIFLAVVGFLLLMVLMSVLKMSSEWSIPALGLFLVVVIGSLLIILILEIIRVKKIESSWKSAIEEIALQQNQQYFEGRGSTIAAGLTSITITVGK